MEAAQDRLSLVMSKCHIVGNHMSRLIIEFAIDTPVGQDAHSVLWVKYLQWAFCFVCWAF